ncbi:MAG: N-acetyltransferase [Aeromicrobium sp.]|nr:MAG: N-acetyltransferase [Aeromicrobium sp.]
MAHNGHVEIRTANLSDIDDLVDLARRTFPLACPPHMTNADIETFMSANLDAQSFTLFVAQPDHRVTVGVIDGEICGYLLLIDEGAVQFVSKCYVDESFHGRGLADLLINDAIETAKARGASQLKLGVSRYNDRANRFYQRHGFTHIGNRLFTVGNQVENDFVLALELSDPGAQHASV